MRAKLMLELSGTSYQEALIIKAIAGTPLEFEKVGRCLVSKPLWFRSPEKRQTSDLVQLRWTT